ncbi:hypothetical protein ANO11243_022700 [Dothideomycetidae sp. 11243]|nr:hypothetical protein ANO11243_022700 [fungal sp. No.11243]
MDFLKSAVASAIAKGPAFGYSFGDRVDIDNSIWTLHHGTKKKLTQAHQTDTYIYVATERIEPLGWKTRRKAIAEGSITWGLHNIAKTLRFINEEAASVHGNVRVSSVFTTESGEWKLAGLESLSSMKEEDAVIYTYGSLVPDSGRYAPPEVAKGGWDSIKNGPVSAVDSYNYGIMISEVFTGGFSGTDQVGKTKDVPPSMQNHYKRLVNASPKLRLSIAHYLEQGIRTGSFFDTPLIQLSDGIENLGLKSEGERDEFLVSELDKVAESDDFPEEFFKVKVLPELLKSAEFGGGGPRVISLIVRFSQKLSEDEYSAQITPVIVRLFQSPDRAMRVTGFTDLAPVVREQTVKAVLVVISKLSDRLINGELLRYLAKTANDDQPGIRTNTTICLGKIAKNLGPNSRTKVLVAAFTRSLRDPFVHARNAALLALGATADLFTEDDCASKLLPCICPALVDKERLVRDQANKTLDLYLQRVRKYGQTLPDSVLPVPETGVAGAPRMGTPSNENTWAGWAISSFTTKFGAASGQMQPTKNGVETPPTSRPTSVPPVSDAHRPNKVGPGQTRLVPISTHSSPAVPRVSISTPTSPLPEEEDFGDDWGAMDDDEVADAWGSPAITKAATAAKSPPAPSATYDDQGEPDFEGWLNAQTQAKKQSGKPLPKGLSKKTVPATTAPKAKVIRTTSTGKPAAQTTTAKPNTKPSPAPAPAPDDGDDWGDAWG